MTVDPMLIVNAVNAAAVHQLSTTPEGRALAAAGLLETTLRLIDYIARNAAGPAAMDIEDSLTISA